MNLDSLSKYQDWGTTALRIIIGIVFLAHGLQKFFMIGVGNVAGFFGNLGIPAPEIMAALVTGVETLGGLALILGLFTRWSAILLAITMLVAIFTAHIASGFFVSDGGFEFALTLMVASITLVIQGSGALALDQVISGASSGAGKTATQTS